MTIFDYENPSLEEINVTVPLRSESGDLYSFVLDFGADRYGTKGLATNAVAKPRRVSGGWVISIHLRLELHHQRNLCPQQQRGYRQGGHPPSAKGTLTPKGRLSPHPLTQRAAAQQTGVVTRHRRVRPNNNNDKYATLAERFQLSTIHELRQLGLYTNTDMLDTAHQLDVEDVTAEVAYTMNNTQLSR